MGTNTYSIPTGVAARYDFQRNTMDYVVAHQSTLGVPSNVLQNIAVLQSNYLISYGVAGNPNTQSKSSTAQREADWDKLEAAISDMYNRYLINNPALSATDRTALGINDRQGRGGTLYPAAITTPVITLIAEEISVLHVVYSDSATANGSHAKPAGVAFCELKLKIDGPPPASVTECPEQYLISRSHESIEFEPEQRGKTVYGYARWVNKNGKQGVWSGQFTAIIP